ncbi:TPA: hypothetical protein ACH3X2_000668 [Trebouxia sp. C0005]
MKLHVEQSGEAPFQVAVANGQLADAYEAILGKDWLSKCSATLSWGHKICVLTRGSHRVTLVPGNADVAPDVRSSANAHAVAAPFTTNQARRALANGCHAFLAVCTDVQTASTASCAAVNGDAEAANTQYESQLMREPDLECLAA